MGLREIRIRDVAVIAAASASIDDGFTVVTGETGSGKSVCLMALRAAVGEKVEPSAIRAKADSAQVSVVFDDIPDSIIEQLQRLGVASDDLLTISREITPRRSVHRINGSLVSASAVKQVASQLLEVTTQGVSDRVYRRDWQKATLDEYGGEQTASLKTAVRNAHRDIGLTAQALRQTEAAAASTAQDLHNAQMVVADLGGLDLRQNDKQALLEERAELRHSGEIAGAADSLARTLNGDEQSLGVWDMISRALLETQAVRQHSPAVERIHVDAEATLTSIRELAREARSVADSTLSDPARLAEVEARLDVIARVERRFGSVEAAMTALQEAEKTISHAANPEKRIAEARTAHDAARATLTDAAVKLSARRRRTAAQLEKRVTENAKLLNLPYARFRIELSRTRADDGIIVDNEPVACSADGVDDIEFRFGTNKDALPMPLGKGPSGGEISRLVLAIGAVVGDAYPAIVFDEVDTGVGGETAAAVGEMLAAMSAHRQVIAVTHRAEIAARASGHLVVTKDDAGPAATTAIQSVDGEDRVVEMARILSGRQTSAAQSRARELLAEGHSTGRSAPPVSAF